TRDSYQTAPSPAMKPSLDAVAEKISAMPTPSGVDSFGKHFHDGVKLSSFEVAVGIRSPYENEELILFPILAGTHGHNLLRQDVQRGFRNFDAVQMAFAHGAHQGGALYQFIARRREDAPFRNRAVPVARPSDALARFIDRPG